jgi:RND family efflux transporter MFP subunit
MPEALRLALVDDEQWTGVSENVLRSALTSDTPEILHSDDSAPFISSVVVKERGGIVFWTLQQHPPLTFAFQTRMGTLGLLQVIRYTEEPHGVRIRYKLVQPPASDATGAPAVNAVAEYRALLGQWKVVRVEKGTDADKDWAKILGYTDSVMNPATASRFDVDEGQLHVLSFETAQTWDFGYRFDPYTRIKQLDLTKVSDSFETGGLRALGIYEIKDGRLKIRLARVMPTLNFDQRPSRFAVDPNSGDVLFTLERFRPSKDEEALESSGGRWAVTSRIYDGKAIAEKQRSHSVWTFSNNTFASLVRGEDANGVQNSESCPMSGLYRLNEDNQPKQITLFAEIGNGAGKFERQDFQGIYKFDGGRLTIAYREGNKPPEQFESKPGSGVTLLALERQAAEPTPVPGAIVPEVPVCRPVVRDVTDSMEFVGRIDASQTVDVRSRVGGELEKVLFAGGAAVKQGDLLFEIDPRQYQAELDKRAADLSAANTRAQHAAAELERAKSLAKSRAISTNDMDRAESERKEAQAAVLAAEANLKLAKLNLDYTKIRAAIGGVISRPQTTVGNLVTAGTQTLATIVCADPICVAFDVDEYSVLDLRRRAAEEKAKTGRELPIEVRCGVANEKDLSRRAAIESKDAWIDPATGTARWRAALPNPDSVLMPGMLARVQLSVGSPHKALLIPERAIRSNQIQKLVPVIDREKNTVDYRVVQVGQMVGELRVITEGLTADDWVVAGPYPIIPGMIVKPKPEDESHGPATSAATPNVLPLAFGPVIERRINAVGEGKGGEGIDFREDKLVDMPKEASRWTVSEKRYWMELHNLDLALDYTAEFCRGEDKRRSLVLLNAGCRSRHIAASRLATATSGEIREELWSDQPVANLWPDNLGEDRSKPSTFGFITGKGDVGVMQVVARHENPGGFLIIRYRVAKKPRSPHLEGDLYSRYKTTIVNLPQGSLELVAVTSDLEPPFRLDHAWWTAGGKPIELVPLRPLHGLGPLGGNGRVRTFLFRFKDLPVDASTIWSTVDCTGEQWIDPVCYADGIVDPELKMVRAVIPDAKAATLRIRVDACRWETGAVWKPDGHGKATFTRDGVPFWVEYGKATAAKNEPGSTDIGLRHSFRWEWNARLVAIGKDGREKVVRPSDAEGEVTHRFSEMPLSSIKEFRFQVRRYYSADFYNVQLNPHVEKAH